MELLQVASEFEPVVEMYRERQPLRVLEIGSWDGGTLKVWLEEAAPELLVAVDLEHRNVDAYDAWRKPGTELRCYTCSSFGEDGIAAIHANGPYDWVMVDGDHGDEGVRADVKVCLPLVSEGGCMVLHDITPPAGLGSYPPGVVLDELEAAGHSVLRFEDPKPETWSHGLGVVLL